MIDHNGRQLKVGDAVFIVDHYDTQFHIAQMVEINNIEVVTIYMDINPTMYIKVRPQSLELIINDNPVDFNRVLPV